MKTKITKIWGVGLTFVLLAMLIGAALPVSAATLGWSTVTTPSAVDQVLQDDSDVDHLVIAPNGRKMFSYDDTAQVLYTSDNFGVTWRSSGIGSGLPASALVALVISPDYDNDSTIVAASATTVYRSINNGESFGEVGTTALQALLATNNITSLDVSPWYLGGTAILVGDSDAGQAGGVSLFTTSSLTWADQSVGSYDAIAVAFSPNHMQDAQILALVNGATDTLLRAKFGGDSWAAGILDATINGATEPTQGVIAFADDYEWSSNNRILVGIAGGAASAMDVYRVHGALPGGTTLDYDLNVGGTGTGTEVNGVSVKGNIAEADVLVSLVGSTSIKRANDPTTSTVTWRSSTKSPTGTSADPIVIWSPTGSDAFVATDGDGSAFQKSTDGGITWNQLALMDVSDLPTTGTPAVAIIDSAVIDSNTMFILMWETADNEGLFKTTNGGSTWERVWYQDAMNALYPSPNYADDETLYITSASSTRIWKTTNGGSSFIGLTAPQNVTAMAVVDKDTYYTGGVDRNIYKVGRWQGGSLKGDSAVSIAVADDGTIFIGTDDGGVLMSTNDGVTTSQVGLSQELGAGNDIIVALDPGYASNSAIYAGSLGDGTSTIAGVYNWTIDSSSVWRLFDDGPGTDDLTVVGMELSADGVLYAASGSTDIGIRRSVSPTGPTAIAADYESVITDLVTDTALVNVNVVSGSNMLYAVAEGDATNDDATTGPDAFGGYGYETRLITYEDILSIAPVLSGPKDGTATPGTSVTLTWKAMTSPIRIYYQIDVATDSSFANITTDGDTYGTAITFTGLNPGTKYWWRVYADDTAGSRLTSKKSAYWTFTPKLASTGTTSLTTAPAPGAIDVSLRPTFQWGAVASATSYEMEFADNPFFANASVKKPLTHTTWTWDTDLEYSTTYYWRVRAVKSGRGILTNMSSWSEASFTTMGKPAPPAAPAAPPQITVQPAPPAPPAQVTIQPAPPSAVTPAVIWAIIIIGAVLVIAVIVLIVRTRRVA